jgi:hypothetical protein
MIEERFRGDMTARRVIGIMAVMRLIFLTEGKRQGKVFPLDIRQCSEAWTQIQILRVFVIVNSVS